VRRDPKIALKGAFAALACLVLTGLVALLSPAAQARDAGALDSITRLNRGGLSTLTEGLVHLADPKPYGVFGLALIAIAVVRGRGRLALILPVVLFCAPLTSELLKPLVATDRSPSWLHSHIADAAWPSGHSTAALTLALCAVLVAPRRLRPAAVVLGALFSSAVAYAILIQAWHFPSDVLGGFLVAATWTLFAVAVLFALEPERREPAREVELERPVMWPVEVTLGGALALALVIAVARPEQVGTFAFEHTTGLAALGAVAALSLALAGGVARTLRR
jgi:membrane-associated phospholipid phosphatase